MITAGIASIPHRTQNLRQTILSLINQVDKINVYLDNYDAVPAFLNAPKIEVIRSQDHPGLGDAGKFFWIANSTGYYFACDDDLLYPEDYVEKTIEKIEYYDRMCLISYHGRILHRTPIRSYYSKMDTAYKFHCLNYQQKDVFVQFGGTGVMGFHTDTLKFTLADFAEPNMADIWVALKAQNNQTPIVVAAHKRDWLTHQVIYGQTIYKRFVQNCKKQTDIVNNLGYWNIHVYKPKLRQGNLVYG